jgi:CRISPR type III-A-associated RAMP protein Csm5
VSAGLFKLECLTPVHVGSGADLIRSIDFYADGGFTEVLDPDLLLGTAGTIEGFADAITRGSGIAPFLKARGLNPAAFRLHRVQGSIEAQRLRLAIRGGDGRPMIPGSSLKGALRTLLLVAWTAEGGPHARNWSAPARQALDSALAGRPSARGVEEAVFHFRTDRIRPNDPKTDVLRTVSVSDAMFAPGSLKVVSSKAVGTTRNTLTAAEALDTGASALMTLKLGDSFLGQHLPFPNAIPDPIVLAGWSRMHADYLLRGDIEFFKNNHEPRLVERLEALLGEVQQSPPGVITLRLGWSTGWRTMTGDLLTPDERGQVPRRVGKTRKVIVEGHGLRSEPCGVFGWMRIAPISNADAAALASATRPVRPEPPPIRSSPIQTSAPTPAIPIVSDAFAARLRGLKPRDWGMVRGLIKEASGHPEPGERERRLGLLAEQLKKTFGSDRKRMRELAGMAEIASYFKG